MKKFNVVAVTGKYTNKDGQEKNSYMTIGSVLETKNGPMLKIESVPVGWNGWAYLNEPDKDTKAPAKRGSVADMDSDIPF